MYKVIERFADLNDNRHEYNPGDIFPREGFVVSEERLAELSTDKNRQKRPLIEEVEEKKPAKVKAEEKPEKNEKKAIKKPAIKKK